jgi:hypothetical protein
MAGKGAQAVALPTLVSVARVLKVDSVCEHGGIQFKRFSIVQVTFSSLSQLSAAYVVCVRSKNGVPSQDVTQFVA